MSKNRTETRKIELVETGNITLALNRLCTPYVGMAWKRALYHAIAMSCARNDSVLEKVRIALDLP